jgi:membrane-associated phospholipid phosphatase
MPKRAKLALAVSCGAVALLLATWWATFHLGFAQSADQSIFNGFARLDRGRVSALAGWLASLCDQGPYVYLAAIPVVIALSRRRPRVALMVAVVLLAANETTQVLQSLVAQPSSASLPSGAAGVLPDAWPSGHSTAAMAFALCTVIAAPSRLRPTLAALGAMFAVAVGYSVLTLGWHHPSDVFAGFLVAGAWTSLGIAALFAADSRWPVSTRGRPVARVSARGALAPSALAVAGAVALGALVVVARPHAALSFASLHAAFMVGAAVIAALGLALAAGLMLALRTAQR